MPDTLFEQLRERFSLAEEIGSITPEVISVLLEIRDGLENGSLRVAEVTEQRWSVNSWIKRALLLYSQYGTLSLQQGILPGTELDMLPWHTGPIPGCRIPGGSFIRHGAYIAPGVTVMPPTTIQIGAYVDEASAIDSHVLIGSCTQIGKRVSIGCGTMIGGVIFPPDRLPTIIEDHVVIGGNCGIYDGVQLGERCAIHAGTMLSPRAGIYDMRSRTYQKPEDGHPLVIPPGSVVSMAAYQREDLPEGFQAVGAVILDSIC